MEDKETTPPVGESRYAFFAVFVLVAVCAVLLVINHKLQKQNIALAEQFRALSAAQGPPIGTMIPALHGTSVSGQSMTLDLTQRENGTLLLVLSPTCPHCKANFHNWQDITRLLPASQTVWVDITETANSAYLVSYAIPADANVIRVNTNDRRLYNLVATPTTIWLAPNGQVKHVWSGELQDDQMKQIRETLGAPKA